MALKHHKDDNGNIYFVSDNPFAVEVTRQMGSFNPVDKRTGEVASDLLYKAEANIYDPTKQHPVLFPVYRDTPMPEGFYLGRLSMSYFQGSYESRLRYEPASEDQFKDAIENNASNKASAWPTGLQVEIYGNDKAGRGYNHEAYLLDPVREQPVLMDCYNRDKMAQGLYELSVNLNRFKGKLTPQNEYIFISPFDTEGDKDTETQDNQEIYEDEENLEELTNPNIDNDLQDDE